MTPSSLQPNAFLRASVQAASAAHQWDTSRTHCCCFWFLYSVIDHLFSTSFSFFPGDTSDGSRMSLQDLPWLSGFAIKCQGEPRLLPGLWSHGKGHTGALRSSGILGQTEGYGHISLLWTVWDCNVILLSVRPEVRPLPVQSHLNLSFYSSLQHSSVTEIVIVQHYG